MCKSAAAALRPSYDSATRLPVPLTNSTRAFPAFQPGRSTICCRTAARLPVRWAAPAFPMVQEPGAQEAEAVVLTRLERLPVDWTKAAALSAASPRIVRLIEPDVV